MRYCCSKSKLTQGDSNPRPRDLRSRVLTVTPHALLIPDLTCSPQRGFRKKKKSGNLGMRFFEIFGSRAIVEMSGSSSRFFSDLHTVALGVICSATSLFRCHRRYSQGITALESSVHNIF